MPCIESNEEEYEDEGSWCEGILLGAYLRHCTNKAFPASEKSHTNASLLQV
jgi:hypothetical protein